MIDRDKVIKGLGCCHNKTMLWQHDQCPYHGFDEDCESNLHADALALLKEQDELLHKKHKDIDRLCAEISEWKHKFHDRPEQDKENGHWIVLEYCANEGIYCSKCMNKIFDRSIKPKKKLSNYCPNCGSKNTHFFNPSAEKIMYSD